MDAPNVRLVDIVISPGRRNHSPKAVQALAQSIADIGLLHPIGVIPEGDEYRLVYGSGRVDAYRYLGRSEIPANVLSCDKVRAELAEIDENLRRTDLCKAAQVKALARRKQLYLTLHPETAKGGDRGNQHTGGKTTDCRSASFSADTASKTGQSRRTVERDVEVGEKLDDQAVEILGDSPAANSKSVLKKLAELPAEEQREEAKRLKEEAVKPKKAKPKPKPKRGKESDPQFAPYLEDCVAKWRKRYPKFALCVIASVLENMAGRIRRDDE
jgi:ParB-like chromosome segregation protein Spo0J